MQPDLPGYDTDSGTDDDRPSDRLWAHLKGRTIVKVVVAVMIGWTLLHAGFLRGVVGLALLVLAVRIARWVLNDGPASRTFRGAQVLAGVLCLWGSVRLIFGTRETATVSYASVSPATSVACSEDDSRVMVVGALQSASFWRASVRITEWEKVGPCAFAFSATGWLQDMNDGGHVGNATAVGRVQTTRGIPQVTSLRVFGP